MVANKVEVVEVVEVGVEREKDVEEEGGALRSNELVLGCAVAPGEEEMFCW